MEKALILLVLHLLMYLLVYFSTVLVIACTGTMLMGALAWAGLFTYSIVLTVMLQISGHLFFDTWYEGSYGDSGSSAGPGLSPYGNCELYR